MLCLEGVPDLPVAPQESLALGSEAETRFFQPQGCEKHYSRTLLSVSSPLFLFIMI